MLFREYELVPTRTLTGVAGTEIIDLNVVDTITELKIAFRIRNSAINAHCTPVSCISRIEIVDGGEVYWSLTGHEALAAAVYNMGEYPFRSLYQANGVNQRDWIPIRFGRFLGDTEYGFDPTRLLNPQLRITWANAALVTAGQTTLQVWTKLMPSNVRPTQMLAWEEVEQHLSAAAGIHIVNLPTDLPMRTLAVYLQPILTVCMTTLTRVRMDCDRGTFIPFDMSWADFLRHAEQWWPRVHYNKHDQPSENDLLWTWMGGYPNVSVQSGSGGFTVGAYCPGTHDYRCFIYTVAGAVANDIYCETEVFGSCPENTVAYPFGARNDPEEWFQPLQYANLRLLLTQGVANHLVNTFLEQVRQVP